MPFRSFFESRMLSLSFSRMTCPRGIPSTMTCPHALILRMTCPCGLNPVCNVLAVLILVFTLSRSLFCLSRLGCLPAVWCALALDRLSGTPSQSFFFLVHSPGLHSLHNSQIVTEEVVLQGRSGLQSVRRGVLPVLPYTEEEAL